MKFLAMPGKRRALMALAVLLIAFGAGFLMQHVLVEQTPMATVDGLPDAARSLKAADEARPLPTPPAATLVPFSPPPPVMPDRVHRPEPSAPAVWDDARMSPFGFDCRVELALEVEDAAMIRARLFSPCEPNRVVSIRHGALEIDQKTDSFGRATAMLPAMSESSTVSVATELQSVARTVSVPGARSISRVVLVWEGRQVFSMHAMEFGASYGDEGHVWAGSPKTPGRAMRGSGGFLIQTGDGSGRQAEVYSFPTGHSSLRGIVELVVEAQATEETCGQTALATTLQSGPLGGMTATDVRVKMPECDKIGDVLRLKNLLQDMRLAGR